MVRADKLSFDYIRRDEEGDASSIVRAVDGVSLHVEEGQFIAILGHNGSGKSTFAKQLNALLTPTEGGLWVDGKDVSEEENVWKVRRRVGMVFQNPDNQIISNVVEEDVGFGPENLGVPTEKIWRRVEEALHLVQMAKYRNASPNRLSGGQKQRVAIAGVLAMRPKCIVLDEPTAMLDPMGRREVIHTIQELNKKEKITIILITHYMEEAVGADKAFVMHQGKLVMEGPPGYVFGEVEALQGYGLEVPQVTMMAHQLRERGINVRKGTLTVEDLVCQLS